MKENVITRKKLVELVHKEMPDGTTRKLVGEVVRAVFEGVTEGLSGGMEVSVYGFGTFRTRTSPAREMEDNLHGKGKISVPAKVRVVFKPHGALRHRVYGECDD